MKEQELKAIIEKLRIDNDSQQAYLGYFKYGGDETESYIRANKQALQIHAAELLEASLQVDAEIEAGKKNYYGLDDVLVDEKSDYYFDYIELTNEIRKAINPDLESESWNDQVFKYGCFTLLIILLGLIVIGVSTVISWI